MSVSFCQTLFKLFFETFYFVSLYRSFLTTLLSYHDCRILSNTFLFFLSSLFHILTRDKKSTLRVRLFELERVKRIELSQSAWKAEVLPLNYTRLFEWSGRQDSNLRPPGPKPGALPSWATSRTFMARPRGVEPLTFWSVVKRSIQLSYGRYLVGA